MGGIKGKCANKILFCWVAMLIKSVSSSGTFYNIGIPTFRLKNKLVNILAFHEKLNSAADVVIFRLLNIIIPMTPKHRTDFGLNHRGVHDRCHQNMFICQ